MDGGSKLIGLKNWTFTGIEEGEKKRRRKEEEKEKRREGLGDADFNISVDKRLQSWCSKHHHRLNIGSR